MYAEFVIILLVFFNKFDSVEILLNNGTVVKMRLYKGKVEGF